VADHDVVVIGAGHGGIASALALKDRGVAALVVDEADQVASRWQARYDRLRLNTSRPTSHLPGRRYPKGTPMFPTRDQVVEHIQGQARAAGLELLLGTRVERLSRGNGSWTVETGKGEIDARQVVLCDRLRERAVDSRLGWPRALRRRADPLGRVPQRRSLQVEAGVGGRPRFVRHGDRPRRCDGRGGEGLAGGANAADDHVS
jgi:flavin-dependent dehydrogenase